MKSQGAIVDSKNSLRKSQEGSGFATGSVFKWFLRTVAA